MDKDSTFEAAVRRRMLEALHGVGAAGMTTALLRIYVETETGRGLTDQEAEDFAAELSRRGWIRSWRNPITDQVRWSITTAGEGARAALGGM